MTASVQAAREALRNGKQDHILPHLGLQGSKVAAQLAEMDVASLRGRLDSALELSAAASRGQDVAPLPDITSVDDLSAQERARLWARGCEAIAAGKVGVLLLAGGQGTRLGTSQPKGCFQLGMPSDKSLFQYHVERLHRVRQLAADTCRVDAARVKLPFLVMTSEATHTATVDYFMRNAYFGLQPGEVHFFRQGMLPCLSPSGDMLLSQPGDLALAPDGNGGVYGALKRSGLLDLLEEQKVTSLFQFCVDNIMCHVADPLFIGFCLDHGADCASKAVSKLDAHEKVGVLALRGGRPGVVEYSEISKEQAERTAPESGALVFSAAHICVNWFSLQFVRRVSHDPACELPLHVARKRMRAVSPDKTEAVATVLEEVDCIKLEMFIFDAFPFARKLVVMLVPREEEFAPVKNATGVDSPETARVIFSEWAKRKVAAAGGNLGAGAHDPALLLEVSPLLSYDGEGTSTPAHECRQPAACRLSPNSRPFAHQGWRMSSRGRLSYCPATSAPGLQNDGGRTGPPTFDVHVMGSALPPSAPASLGMDRSCF